MGCNCRICWLNDLKHRGRNDYDRLLSVIYDKSLAHSSSHANLFHFNLWLFIFQVKWCSRHLKPLLAADKPIYQCKEAGAKENRRRIVHGKTGHRPRRRKGDKDGNVDQINGSADLDCDAPPSELPRTVFWMLASKLAEGEKNNRDKV